MAGVLIVVDVQNGFTKLGNLASPRCLAAVPRIRAIAEEAARRKDHLIFTADTHSPDDAEFAMFPPHCVAGTPEADIVDELSHLLPGVSLVRKTRYSAFFGTSLASMLEELAPVEVTVVGMCTDICVLHTVADLRNRDWPVVIPAGGVDTFDAPGHDADEVNRWALDHMRSVLGATIS